MNNNDDAWLEKCMKCKHSYASKTEDGEFRCRCRNGRCNYEEVKLKTEVEK